jgi:hypothetical protein
LPGPPITHAVELALAERHLAEAEERCALSGFYAHARGAAEAIGTTVVVIGADLRQRLHTGRPFGSPLPVTNAAEAVRATPATGRPARDGPGQALGLHAAG